MSTVRIPKAILLSDIHFNVHTVKLASEALKAALSDAESKNIPLIIAGDLLDTKAIIRAECANAIISIVENAKTEILMLVSNHDMINEKSKEHSLNFLRPYATVIDTVSEHKKLWFIPYQSTADDFREALKLIPPFKTIIAHQGLNGAFMGEYTIDKSSIDPKELRQYRVILGHYHRAQTLGDKTNKRGLGLCSYIGSPYTISFAEANDGPKGYQILYVDGSLEQVPLNLRKHVVVERDYTQIYDPIPNLNKDDLLWIKVRGPASELDTLDKKEIGKVHLGHESFKLDKIYTDSAKQTLEEVETMKNEDVIDSLIENSPETKTQKVYLRKLWRAALS